MLFVVIVREHEGTQCTQGMLAHEHAKHARHVSTQDTLALKHVSMREALAREHVGTQGTLDCKHVSTQGTLARKARQHVSTQGTLAREHARHVVTWARKHARNVTTWARKARSLAGSIASYYIIYTNHFDIKEQRQLYVKLTIFLLLPVSTLNTIVHN